MSDIDRLKIILAASERLVFFGGAGVSTESNIPDFRSASGLYAGGSEYTYPPEVMLSRSFFESHPEEFFNFYRSKMVFQDAIPNEAHLSLAVLEGKGILDCVVTQNIDGLHQKAGSKKVIELHGSIYRNYCMRCSKSFELGYILDFDGMVPLCDICGNIIKPDVVLYEEPLKDETVYAAVEAISMADTLMVGGTSLAVYPAAGLLRYFRGDNLVLINKSPTAYDSTANLVINESIGSVLKEALQP